MNENDIRAYFYSCTCNECRHYDAGEGECCYHKRACHYLAEICPAFKLDPFIASVIGFSSEDLNCFLALLKQKYPENK